jgi:TetR/AcrR family fatty acid metabolism transcriptional regulator
MEPTQTKGDPEFDGVAQVREARYTLTSMSISESQQPGRPTRRVQILDAAAAVFAERGYDETRIQDVAAAAGVAYGLVYHYFGTKDALLQTVLASAWSSFADDLEGIRASGKSGPDQVRAVVDYVFGAFDTFPDVVKVVLTEQRRFTRDQAAPVHPEVRRALDALREMFSQAHAQGSLRAGLDPTALPPLLLGALEAAFSTALQQGDPGLSSLRRTVHILLQTGIFPSPTAT